MGPCIKIYWRASSVISNTRIVKIYWASYTVGISVAVGNYTVSDMSRDPTSMGSRIIATADRR